MTSKRKKSVSHRREAERHPNEGNGHGHMRHTGGGGQDERRHSMSDDRHYGRHEHGGGHSDDDEGYGRGRRDWREHEQEHERRHHMDEDRGRSQGRYESRDNDYGVSAGRRSNAWYGNPEDREAWSRERGSWGDGQYPERRMQAGHRHRDEDERDYRSGGYRSERGVERREEWRPEDQSYFGSRDAGRRMARAYYPEEGYDDYRSGGYGGGRREGYGDEERHSPRSHGRHGHDR